MREVAREAGIAPNSFYRQFRDMDELAVALIERAGQFQQERKLLEAQRITDKTSFDLEMLQEMGCSKLPFSLIPR